MGRGLSPYPTINPNELLAQGMSPRASLCAAEASPELLNVHLTPSVTCKGCSARGTDTGPCNLCLWNRILHGHYNSAPGRTRLPAGEERKALSEDLKKGMEQLQRRGTHALQLWKKAEGRMR